MFKYLFAALVLSVTATPAMAQLTAGEFVEKLKPAEGKPLGETNISVVSVRAEGTLAVLTLDSPDWGTDRATVGDVFIQTFCEGGKNPAFLSNMRLRIDTLQGGKALMAGKVFDKCPPAPAE